MQNVLGYCCQTRQLWQIIPTTHADGTLVLYRIDSQWGLVSIMMEGTLVASSYFTGFNVTQ